jgi:hypothetical protein
VPDHKHGSRSGDHWDGGKGARPSTRWGVRHWPEPHPAFQIRRERMPSETSVNANNIAIPWYDILEERGFEVFLVNARHTKNLPGRKTDVQESQWLLKLYTHDLSNNSFQPSSDIRVLRTYWRLRAEHATGMATCIQRLQNILTQMKIQLANFISDLSGTTGQATVRAILNGERDAQKMAGLRNGGIFCNQRGDREKPAG